MKINLVLILFALMGFQTFLGSQDNDTDRQFLLLDDFSGEASAIGTRWEGFTDQVMGGKSEINTRIEREEQSIVLHLGGTVSLENNGGFIQMRLLFNEKKRPFDASDYKGVALRVRGNDQGYYVHLRTTRTVFPWSYYAQKFPVGPEWNTVYLPFNDFAPESLRSSGLNPAKLTSIAIVAAKRNFSADLYVDSVSLYR